jgi:tetratricopeptide (TPR) repeat protein
MVAGVGSLVAGVAALWASAAITIDYPLGGSVFPPEITAPEFLWRDPAASAWSIDFEFGDSSPGLHAQAAARSWRPDESAWAAIKSRSVERPVTVTITGLAGVPPRPVSRGRVTIQTSRDPVGAPIFYRDVPLMPSELEKGVIKPLPPAAIPLIAWRLRDLGQSRSRLVLEGLHSCTNCHSFSRDGKTMGMDVDGPENDKGTYAIVPISPRMTIRNQDVITWNSFAGKPAGRRTIGFLSQISPDGRHAVTTLNEEVYVANFKDYRILQVFYPTRGILAWYCRDSGRIEALPGADDPRYVHTDAVWSPDGRWLVFARAEARDAYPPGRKLAEYAGDPNEIPIQYDLYRIPFSAGRGGRPEPVRGASGNGMSNTFPKVSPDGRWIVFVKCRNGQLMRPDSELWIVPAEGGLARRMRCNTSLMNSWHSFSPNGRWLVFSSKSRSPYTQMFLTHLDEEGRDTPPVLVENATAADRAVNIPEFVNIPPDGLLNIDVPAAEFYRLFDSALALHRQGRHEAAVAEWKKALELDASNAKAHTNLGMSLSRMGATAEALAHMRKAVELNPYYAEAHNNLGVALVQAGKPDEAIAHFRVVLRLDPDMTRARHNLAVALLEAGRLDESAGHFRELLEANPESAEMHYSLGNVLYLQGRIAGALAQWRQGLRRQPDNLPVLNQIAWVLATSRDASVRNGVEALNLATRAAEIAAGREPEVLDTLAAAYAEVGRFSDAIETARRGLALAIQRMNRPLAEALKVRIALYERGTPFREAR